MIASPGSMLVAGLALPVVVVLAVAVLRCRRAAATAASERRRLERALSERDELLYVVSHDLKSPLVTIRGFLGLIADDVRDGNVERLERDVERVDGAVEKMAGLLDDLLERSRAFRKPDGAASDSRSTPPPPAAASPRSTP